MSPTSLELQRLLAEDRWIRRIARRLAGDPHRAEDLAQDAWVAALSAETRPERTGPWLAGVLRNLQRQTRRGDVRRTDREERTAREEVEPSAADVAGELMLRKHVTECLLELDEPYRTAVFLRYYRELPLKAVAEQQGVSASTAHARVEAGLRSMRSRLDTSYSGNRQAWCLGLLALAPPKGIPPALFHGLAMTTLIKVTASLALVAGALYWALDSRDDAPPALDSLSAAEEVVETAPTKPALTLETPAAPARREAGGADADATETPVLLDEQSATLDGRVVDRAGAPRSGVEVGFEGRDERTAARSDAEGRFTLVYEGDELPAQSVIARGPRHFTLVPGTASDTGGPLVVVAARLDFAGRVVDPEGQPVEGARVVFQRRQELYDTLSITRPMYVPRAELEVTTDELGKFHLRGVAGGAGVALQIEAAGFTTQLLDLPARDDGELLVQLARQGGRQLSGVVLDAKGLPVPGASVAAGQEITKTDERGGFQLLWKEQEQDPFARDFPGDAAEEPHLVALKLGHGAFRAPLAELEADVALTLVLPAAAGQLQGRVLDAAGRPVAGAIVWISDPTPFGRELISSGDSAAIWNHEVESELSPDRRSGVRTDETGAFTLHGLFDREYEVRCIDERTLERAPNVHAFPGATGLELRLDERATSRIAGRVVSASGLPLAGVQITPRADRIAGELPRLGNSTATTTTDEEGRFAFERVATEGAYLQLFGDAVGGFSNRGLARYDDLEAIELVILLPCELQIELEDPTLSGVTEIEVLDGEERRLTIHESFGTFLAMRERIALEGERSGVLSVKESARTLVLYRDGEELRRLPLALDPTELTIVRL